jgi:cytoskeleton protein RodZ
MAIVSSPHSLDTSATPTDSRDAGSSLGELLRHAREDRGLTLETIANETKIPRRHLEALEHDNLAAAPGRFYQRAEIRAYARAVGIDQKHALARLEALLKADEPDKVPVEVPKRRDPSTVRAYVQAGLGVALMAAAALLGRPLFKDTPTLPDGGGASAPRPTLQTTAVTPQRQPSDAVALVLAPQESVVLSETPVKAAVITQEQARTETPVPSGDADASTATVTELVVRTQPEGARVTVNGVGWGTSPVTIRYLTTGDKRIRVSKEGYLATEQVLHVFEGRRHALTIQLAAAR